MEFSFYHPNATPNFIAALVMFLWLPFVFWVFRSFPSRRAIVITFVVAALYLPEAQLVVPGFPDYTKLSAASYGVLLFTIFFDVQRIRLFRFGWLDIPILVWCVSPLFSSLTNGLGWYDGLSSTLEQTMIWGIPFFLGRIYLNDLEGLYQLAVGIFAGGVTYIPLALFEMRMSPQLHTWLYGGFPHGDFAQSVRLGGFRPVVFTSHGLVLSFWMMASVLIGIWLWKTDTLKKVFNIPMNVIIPIFLMTFLLLRSTGAYILLAMSLAVIFASVFLRSNIIIYLIVSAVFGYLIFRSVTDFNLHDYIINAISPYLPAERVGSLQFRFENEDILSDKARLRMLFGWGGYGRNLIFDEWGNQSTIVDSVWIITFGMRGLLGLFSLFSTLLLPVLSVVSTKCPCRLWDRKSFAAVGVLTVALLFFSVEVLVNAPALPPITLICGALTGYVVQSSLNPKQYGSLVRKPVAAR
jgi:hypothetical protein